MGVLISKQGVHCHFDKHKIVLTFVNRRYAHPLGNAVNHWVISLWQWNKNFYFVAIGFFGRSEVEREESLDYSPGNAQPNEQERYFSGPGVHQWTNEE